jgi:hypothetical protein
LVFWSVSAAVLLGLGTSIWLGQAAGAAPAISASFTVNGHPVAHSGNLKLDPAKPANLGITVTNNGSSPVLVNTVALVGKALDITFFDFETETGLTVAPGATVSQQYSLSLAPLNGQGDGLIPASVELLDANRHVLVSEGFTADVQGKITSLFGLFAIEITIFTALLFAGAILALSRGTLHENRFRRGLRFMWPGLGLGLVIVFAFSILRIFAPSASHWLPVVLICTIAGFAVGYLTPNPPEDEPIAGPDVTEPVTVASPPVDPRATLPVTGG